MKIKIIIMMVLMVSSYALFEILWPEQNESTLSEETEPALSITDIKEDGVITVVENKIASNKDLDEEKIIVGADKEKETKYGKTFSGEAVFRLYSNEISQDLLHIAIMQNVDDTDVFPMQINPQIFSKIEIGDLVALALPEDAGNVEMYVSKKYEKNNGFRIKGHVDGLDKGFGVSISHQDNFVNGYIITPDHHYDIVTVESHVFLIRKSHNPDPEIGLASEQEIYEEQSLSESAGSSLEIPSIEENIQ